MNIGKVKSFKEKINKEEVEDHPAKEIKKIVKAIEEDSLEEEETTIKLTSSEKERLTLDKDDVDGLLNYVKEPFDLEKGNDIEEENEPLIPPESESEPGPEPETETELEPESEVKEKVDEIIDDIESNTKETQTEENKDDVIIEVKEEKSESTDDDLFKEENEIKDFLGKIE